MALGEILQACKATSASVCDGAGNNILLGSQWGSCFFLFLTREKGRTSNSFAAESLAYI